MKKYKYSSIKVYIFSEPEKKMKIFTKKENVKRGKNTKNGKN